MKNNKERKMGQNYLTEGLITDIISRVPDKDLWRFTCVSKSWCSLIRTDPYLSRLQRTASLDRPCLFIEEIYTPASGNWLESVEGNSINLVEIQNPLDDQVLATCQDLLVHRIHPRPNKYAVSNPITRRRVMVPPNPAGDDNVVFFGFGYDRVHDCYKLLTRVKHSDQSLELMVYDIDKGTWRRLQFGTWWKSQFQDSDSTNDLYSNWDHCNAKCVDGAVCRWFSMRKPGKTNMMVCFLLAEEDFHVVKPPDLGHVADYYGNSMTIFDGKLGLMCQGLDTRHEFWSVGMDRDDDGKRQWRWTKLLAISDVQPSPRGYAFLIPVCFSACKNKILILSHAESQLYWYDIVEDEFNKLNNPISGRCQEGHLFSYDMVKKELHKLHNPIDNHRRFSGMKILGF